MKNFKWTLIAALLLLGFVILQSGKSDTQPAGDEFIADEGAGNALIGGTFTLTDQNGKMVRDEDYRGKLMLVFFGFTHCPDICPVTISTLSHTLDTLGDGANKIATLFITVDPERDTPSALKNYLSNFNPHLTGLTGTPEQIKTALNAYKAYAARSQSLNAGALPDDPGSEPNGHDDHHKHDIYDQPAEEENYTVDHSGFVYLMDRDGKYIRHFQYNVSEKELTEAVRAYLK